MAERAVRKAVVTAAGRGTRQFPATRTIQKELMPLVDVDGYAKPTLQIILEEILRSGIEQVCVVANRSNAAPIAAHFKPLDTDQLLSDYKGKEWVREQSDRLAEIGRRLTVVVQDTQDGYGHAVFQARDWAAGEPFVLMTGDHINVTEPGRDAPGQLVDIYARHGGAVTSVAFVPEADVPRYGTALGEPIAPDVFRMRALVEKPSIETARERLRSPGVPEGRYLCFYGIHVFPAELFDCLEATISGGLRHNGEYQLATAQQMLLERSDYLLARIDGEQYDMGTPDGLIKTQMALALRSPYGAAIRGQLREFDRP